MNAVDPYAPLFAIAAKDRPKLSESANMALLAKLKATDAARFEELFAHLRDNKVPRLRPLEQEVNKLVREAEKNKAARIAKEAAGGERGDFQRNEDGVVLPTQRNIRLAIEKLGVSLRYDAFAGFPVIEGLDGFGPALDDHAVNRLWLTIDEEYGFRPSSDFFNTVLNDTCQRNRFNPVTDYLDGLAWDGKPRLDRWLVDYCGVEDTPYARAVGALMLIAAVRRVRHPGSKFDEMLVLESPEGFSKSTLLRELAVRDDWFTDSLPLNVDDKRMIEAASGKWIIECAELQGMRKGDVGKIKAQLSRARDRARLAYGRLPVEVPRQCVFFGTVNPDDAEGYLASLTGNRRFWPVKVTKIDLEAFRRDRDQLWAEASAREAEGASTRLDPALWDAAGEQQSAREAPNPLRDALSPYLSNRQGVIFTSEVWTIANVPIAQRTPLYGKLGKAMKDLGWQPAQRRRAGAAPERAYVRGDETYRITAHRDHGELQLGRIDRNKETQAVEEATEDLTGNWLGDE